MLVFNLCLKDVEMYMQEHKLMSWEAMQLKQFTTEHNKGIVEFYVDTNSGQSVSQCSFQEQKTPKIGVAVNTIRNSLSNVTGEQKKSSSQIKKEKRKVQLDLIAQQKQEIENLKAMQSLRMNPQKFVSTIMQVMFCMYVAAKNQQK